MENKEKNNWIYFGVFLDDESKNKLKEIFGGALIKSWKVYCHHMTIAFNDGSEKSQKAFTAYEKYFGKKCDLVAIALGTSDDAVAVEVDFKGKTLNKIPHITIATPANGKPVNSNYITDWQPLDEPIKLSGTLKPFLKK